MDALLNLLSFPAAGENWVWFAMLAGVAVVAWILLRFLVRAALRVMTLGCASILAIGVLLFVLIRLNLL